MASYDTASWAQWSSGSRLSEMVGQGAMAPPDVGRSGYLYLNQGGRLRPPNYHVPLPPGFSDLPTALGLGLLKQNELYSGP